jgi:hypothetical protein
MWGKRRGEAFDSSSEGEALMVMGGMHEPSGMYLLKRKHLGKVTIAVSVAAIVKATW